MASLIAECPNTRAPIDTGIDTGAKSLAKLWATSVDVRCPHCEEEHTISVRDAYIESATSRHILGRD